MKIYEDLRPFHSKLKWGRSLFIAITVVLCARFWQLQVIRAPTYRELARANHVRRIPENAPRGLILDRYGRIVGENRPSFNLMVEESRLDAGTLTDLVRILGLNRDELGTTYAEREKAPRYSPVLVKEDILMEEVALVEARQLELPGAIIQFVPRRFYPFGSLAAHVLGYVGRITEEQIGEPVFGEAGPNDYVGQSGVEMVYDRKLFGRNGVQRVVVNSHGRRERALEETPPVWGDTLRLSLDIELQRAVEEAFGSRAGGAVVLDPRNGQLLAVASFPSFDPNFFSARFGQGQWQALVHDEDHRLQNRTIQGRYPPGSVFKLIVAAAALEEGLIDPSTRINCHGWTRIYGTVFRCHRTSGHGAVDLHQALVQSCNTYFYQLGAKIPIETIARYARTFGLGALTAVDLPFEVSGLVPDPEWKRRTRSEPWYAGETISVAVGQGSVLVTPLQMAQLAAIVGSRGEIHRPRLLLETFPPGQVPDSAADSLIAQPIRRVGLSDSTWRVLQDAMWGVVNEGGTGWRARLPDVEVCGKTGTAQVVSNAAVAELGDTERPEHLQAHAWFVGYAPRVNPEVALAVLVEHGRGGGQAAAPIAGEILKAYFEGRARRKANSVRQASVVRN